MENEMLQPGEGKTEVRTYFVRERNAVLARADFCPLYIEHYLHLADTGQNYGENDGDFKELLAAMVLHAAVRPWNELFAWTVHYDDPGRNFFVNCDNRSGSVAGTVFTENIRTTGKNLLYSDWIQGKAEPRRSVVDFPKGGAFTAAEEFHRQSEQRTGRYFLHSGEDYVLIQAQPDVDEAWLSALTEEAVQTIDQQETLALLEKRYYRWQCGCSQERLLKLLAPEMRRDPDGLFEEQNTLRIQCPRCGRKHLITKESLEAELQKD
jgi:molecular chaperone Hsp33